MWLIKLLFKTKCPSCRSKQIVKVGYTHDGKSDKVAYYCNKCGNEFEN